MRIRVIIQSYFKFKSCRSTHDYCVACNAFIIIELMDTAIQINVCDVLLCRCVIFNECDACNRFTEHRISSVIIAKNRTTIDYQY